MIERVEPASQYAWIVYAIAFVIVGGLGGYVVAIQTAAPRAVTAAAGAPAAMPASAPIVDEGELRAYREILARDPKSLGAAVKAANMLHDAGRYSEAIVFYKQAFALDASDINVSTDLGTALWHSGRPDEALAQYAKSLAIDPNHGQTLFNMGIVRADGKRDFTGAVAAWEHLLETSPGYPDVAHVRSMIADARQKMTITP
jgi:thioredoxin-like negative regulator of GroEL